MPDFLGRLAERTLGLGEVVQPRLPPLFAAGAELAGEELEVSETSAALRSEAPAAPPMTLVGQASAEASVEAPEANSPEAPGDASDAQSIGPRIVGMEEPPSPVSARSAASAPSAEKSPLETIGVRAVRETEPPLLLPAQHAAPDPSLFEQPSVTAGRPPAPTPSPGRPLARALSLTRTPDAPPTVRVTIGRVEVRAVFPVPEASRPAPPPQPSLTLDEYLKQRREGAR